MRYLLMAGLFLCLPVSTWAESQLGYYRFPALHADTIVFTAEGDLWTVGVEGGVARRLTSHPGQERGAAISPDGATVAFSADYEGPTEVYTMLLEGGLPRRHTYEGGRARVVGWTPAGRLLYATRHYSTLPNTQLVELDLDSGERRVLPLSQASDGVYDAAGEVLFFTRLPFQGSHTKRYKGGTAQNLWRYQDGSPEATPLTGDYPGISRAPLFWQGRIYFTSDRDGTMNLWSMAEDGDDLRQHTRHQGWDVKSPSLSHGRIVYQLGADLHLYEISSGEDRGLSITLSSDFDQMREKWEQEPEQYLTAAHLSPDGGRVALTARGRVFVVPVEQGRRVEATRSSHARYRSARFLPDGKSLLVLSDESGEVELWRLDARGLGAPKQLTFDGTALRFDAVPSPDGRWAAYTDKDQELWVLELETGRQARIEVSPYFDFGRLAWSGDSRWLAYVVPAGNFFSQIKLYNVVSQQTLSLTSDRFDSYSPAWSPDGKWIYLLSDRNLVSAIRHPWGSYQPGPFLDEKGKIFLIALQEGLRSPFQPPDELFVEEKDGKDEKPGGGTASRKRDRGKDESEQKEPEKPPAVTVDAEGIQARLQEVPLPPGNYSNLSVNESHLFYISSETAVEPESSLMAVKIDRRELEPKTILDGVESYELSSDGKKLLVRKNEELYVLDADGEPVKDLKKRQVSLEGWIFSLDPQEEWRQMFLEAWRLERDYFYDPEMHGVDWKAMLEKYRPLVERVTDRAELSHLFGEMVGELSALHTFVGGGDFREGDDEISPAYLGARLSRDPRAGGYRVEEVYRTDPDLPQELSPLSRPGVGVSQGDVILSINGVSTLEAADPARLLRNQAGRQVHLEIQDLGSEKRREVIVEPITARESSELRYAAWEYSRRLLVEEWGQGEIGYVHLRAMGGGNYTEWARHFFPVFNRKGLIVDVRHNRGGNIDSWILGSLIRKAWMWWQPRVGVPYSNMQYAFTGHMVVLVDEFTASDGEAFAEGFRRLGLGSIIGTRTWGGEIWLTSSNLLVDKGIATAAEFGVYGPEGTWLIEGHGVEPDVVVDNLPHATFLGGDAQLRTAVEHLQRRIQEEPVQVPEAPPYPDKSLRR